MSEWIELVVAGLPVTQGSKRAFVHPGTNGGKARAVVVDVKPARLRSWREAIAAEARAAMHERSVFASDIPFELRVTFLMPKPAGAPVRRRTWPVGARSGDADKLLRAVFDALHGVVYVNDSQVTSVTELRKDYSLDGWTGALIRLRPIGVAHAPSSTTPEGLE